MKNYLRKTTFALSYLSAIILNGCTSGPDVYTLSNGRSYYVDPSKCPNFKILSDRETVGCFSDKKKFLYTLKPLSNAQANAIKANRLREQIEIKQSLDNLNNTLKQTNDSMNARNNALMNYMNESNAYISNQMQQAQSYSYDSQLNTNKIQTYNIRQIGTNNYMVNGSDMYRVTQEGDNRVRVYDRNGNSTVYRTDSSGTFIRGSDGITCMKVGNIYQCKAN